MGNMISVQGIAKRYDGFSLENVTFSVSSGCVVGLIGSNGVGKTTILKVILGLTKPDAGTVELLGCNPHALASETEMDKVKARVGVVFDTCSFPVVSRVSDIGALGRAAYRSWDQAEFEALCLEFGLEMRKTVNDLSRGMGMKLTLAFALSHQAELLILDEATAGLDPMARDEVLDILRSFMEDEDHAILLSSHITSDLEKIADEVVCIEDGHIAFDLPKDAICDEAGVAHCRTSDIECLVRNQLYREAFALQRGMATDVLVPDRRAFSHEFPEIAIDRTTVDDYMTLTLKGSPLAGAVRLQESPKEA